MSIAFSFDLGGEESDVHQVLYILNFKFHFQTTAKSLIDNHKTNSAKIYLCKKCLSHKISPNFLPSLFPNLSRSLYWVETLHWRQILVKNLGNKDVTAEPVFVRPIHECLGDSPPQVISCVSHPSPSPDFHLLLV